MAMAKTMAKSWDRIAQTKTLIFPQQNNCLNKLCIFMSWDRITQTKTLIFSTRRKRCFEEILHIHVNLCIIHAYLCIIF